MPWIIKIVKQMLLELMLEINRLIEEKEARLKAAQRVKEHAA
jgi:hypothetical protein